HLPGTLVSARELVGGHLVAQGRDVVEYPREGIIAEHGLIAEQQGMSTMAGRQLGDSRLVIDASEQPVTLLLRVIEFHSRAEHPITYRLAVAEAVESLLVDILELGIPASCHGALPIEGIVGTGIIETVAGRPVQQLWLMAELGVHLAVPRLVEQTAGAELAALQRQPGNITGDQAGTLIGRWQQANIAEGQYRQVGGQLTEPELGLRPAHLESGSQTTVFVLRPAIAAGR